MLLRCGYMYAGTLVHISRHLGKMSNNNNKRCQLWICCMLYRVCFHQILYRISGYDPYYIIIVYICLTSCVLLHQSPTVILLYHEYFLLDITCYISTYFIMYVLTTQFSIHVYDLDLSIHMCLSSPATWHSHHHSLGRSDSSGSSYPGLEACSLWILSVADQRGSAVAWIISRPSRVLSLQAPLLGSRVFLL